MPLKPKEFGSVEFASGETKRARLPGNDLLRGIRLDVAGNFVASGGASDPTIAEDAPMGIVSQVKISLGGKEIYRASGIDLFYLAFLRKGVAPDKTTPTISGAATYAFACSIPVDFGAPGSRFPQISNLRTTPEQTAEVEVTWGTSANIASGGDRALSVSSVTCKIVALHDSESPAPKIFRTLITQRATIPAANTKFTHELPFGPGIVYRGILIKQIYSSARSNTPINNVIVRAGAEEHIFNLSAAAMRREYQSEMGIVSYPTGLLLLDFDRDKEWRGLLDTSALGNLTLELDVAAPSGTTYLDITSDLCRKL